MADLKPIKTAIAAIMKWIHNPEAWLAQDSDLIAQVGKTLNTMNSALRGGPASHAGSSGSAGCDNSKPGSLTGRHIRRIWTDVEVCSRYPDHQGSRSVLMM